ncbi:hypothetical protein NCC49_003748 [Naganishia albida]|nr:hypothetical protein NCC49_003748 [Naganishia albida]
MDLALTNIHVLITGAAGGIGITTVREFLAHGALVTAQYRSTRAALDEAFAGEIKQGRVQCLQADVTREEDVEVLFKEAEKGMMGKPVSVLIVNHAIYESTPAPLHEMSLAQWNRTLETNLTGGFLVVREFMRRLVRVRQEEGEGSEALRNVAVVFVGSTAGEYGEASHADYAASKSGLTHGLQLSLKNEIVRSVHPRARVNTVAPGWVRTKMAEESMRDEAVRYQAMATTPLNKIAEPEEVAMQIVFLASHRVSGHTTGQVVMVHGGMEGRLLNPKP